MAVLAVFAGRAYAANNRPEGGRPDGLMDYQVKTLRVERIEVMDENWGIRIVMDVHDGVPIVAVYNEVGVPVNLVTVDLR